LGFEAGASLDGWMNFCSATIAAGRPIPGVAAHDWPQAIAQLREGLQVCGQCSALALLHKNLGLTYCRSGDLKNGLAELLEAKKLTPQDTDIDQAIRFVNSAQK